MVLLMPLWGRCYNAHCESETTKDGHFMFYCFVALILGAYLIFISENKLTLAICDRAPELQNVK